MNKLNKDKILTIILARMGSSRLPGKVHCKIGNTTALEFIIERCKELFNWPNIVLATTNKDQDNVLIDTAKKHGIKFFRGSESDVAQRFFASSAEFKGIEWLHRLNADNIFFDYEGLNSVYDLELNDSISMISNVNSDHIPGFSIELVKKGFYEEAMCRFSNPEKEHVTKHFYDNLKIYKNRIHWLENIREHKEIVLDTIEDLKTIDSLVNKYQIKSNSKIIRIQEALASYFHSLNHK